MTLEEILRSQGMSEEQIQTVTGEMKQNKIFTSAEENLDIRYKKLKDDYDNLTTQHREGTQLIEQLKAGTKNSEELQGQIGAYEVKMKSMQEEYEAKVREINEQMERMRLDNALGMALRDAKAVDADYLSYKLYEKLKEKGEELSLDGNGAIKGWDEKLSGLKTQFPTMFETASSSGMQVLGDNRLPGADHGMVAVTKEQFHNMSYEERVALKQQNEQAYRELAKNN